MALVPSNMLALGTRAPGFTLPNTVSGDMLILDDAAGDSRALLVMFICNHCPYVVHIQDALGPLARDLQPAGVSVVAISSNSVATHPQDGPEQMKRLAGDLDWSFPYLYDESQDVARAYQAACTPDFYVFDSDRKLAYRGQLDDSRPGNGKPVTGESLRAAVDAVVTGAPVPTPQKPSIGCNIKWHP